MKIKHWLGILCCSLSIHQTMGQVKPLTPTFNRQDTLRGSLNEERTGWNVLYYDITVAPDYNTKKITGVTTITFQVLRSFDKMQIDLQAPMQLDAAYYHAQPLSLQRDGNVYHLSMPHSMKVSAKDSIQLLFSGSPRVAVNPPWDGGWIFTKDQKGRPWMSVACQGLGASVWFPCKDHQSDEPDHGATVRMVIPDSLEAVANGRLIETHAMSNHQKMVRWAVVNPINNYNIIPYIGKYVHWSETYTGLKGPLSCDYWVLDYEEEKARSQFQQAPLMLKSFEDWFGPYPFYEDGYKLVQSPHLGMEHQSAVGYGNGFKNGYRGRDLSGSGWGLKWDFIIVHESGHEWFGNNITSNDLADMYIHESFTNYSETLFTATYYGTEAGNDYVIGTRKLIANAKPIIGAYGVNNEGSGDMYYKGGNMIHTIRQLIHNDTAFKQLLRDIQKKWYHKTLDSKELEAFIIEKTRLPLESIFEQYLRHTEIPTLEYRIQGNALQYRFTDCIPSFQMHIRLTDGTQSWTIPATTSWKTSPLPRNIDKKNIQVDRNFYVKSKCD